MAKEVRLNDKLWFGKYKNLTFKMLLGHDPTYLNNLIDKGKITFHQNIKDYLNSQEKPKKSPYGNTSIGGSWRPSYTSDWESDNWWSGGNSPGWSSSGRYGAYSATITTQGQPTQEEQPETTVSTTTDAE